MSGFNLDWEWGFEGEKSDKAESSELTMLGGLWRKRERLGRRRDRKKPT
jgi:hypothetical protein